MIEYFRKLNIVVCRFVHIFMPIKREAGEIPARSRRCDGETLQIIATGRLGRHEELMNLSQKTCLQTTPETLRAIGEVYDLRNCNEQQPLNLCVG